MSLTRESVIELVDQLYKFRDLYIEEHSSADALNKQRDVKEKMKQILTVLEDNQSSLSNKAEFFMLKGKCLNVQSEYDESAEDSLSKAVKLDPKLVEAWNVLGEVFWKKGDTNSAKNCFTGALQHSRNKVSLRNLSMVLRQFGKTREEKYQFINESVGKAKEAVELDLHDGTSWFILGNAYLSLFFGGAQNEKVIKSCLKAYSQAEKDAVAKNNPDLHFNRAMCHMYESKFDLALEGFENASILDPVWDIPKGKVEMLRKYLEDLHTMASQKCGLVGKNKLQKLISGFSETLLGPYSGGSYTNAQGKCVKLTKKSLAMLNKDINLETVVIGKVIGSITIDSSMPYSFVIIDEDSNCMAICLYNLSSAYGLKSGDSVAIAEPYLMTISLKLDTSLEPLTLSFIRVESPMVLVVNGKKLGVDKQALSVLKVTTQSE